LDFVKAIQAVEEIVGLGCVEDAIDLGVAFGHPPEVTFAMFLPLLVAEDGFRE
jgi:hypothetical protein